MYNFRIFIRVKEEELPCPIPELRLMPTNPALLISLGLAGVGYSDWFKWNWKFQSMNIVLTSFILLLGLYIGY
jgi:hypothetical protein